MRRPELNLLSAVRGGSQVGFSNAVSTAFAAAISIVLARELGPAGFGAYSVAMAVTMLASTAAALGQGPLIIANIARVEKGHSGANPVRSSFTIVLVASVIVAGFIVGAWTLVPRPQAVALGGTAIAFVAVLVLTIPAGTMVSESFRGFRRFAHASLFGLLARRFLFAALLVGALLSGFSLTPAAALGLHATASVLATAGGMVALSFHTPPGHRPAASVTELLTLARVGFPVLVTQTGAAVRQRLPVWALGTFGSVASAGLYALAVSFTAVTSIVKQTVNGTLAPYIASDADGNSGYALERKIRLTAAVATIMTMVAGLAIFAVSWLAIPLIIGDAFIAALPVVFIMIVARTADAATGPCGLVLILTGNQKYAMHAGIFSTAFAIAFVIPASAFTGVVGTAIVAVMAVLVNNVTMMMFARRETGLWTGADPRGIPELARRSLHAVWEWTRK